MTVAVVTDPTRLAALAPAWAALWARCSEASPFLAPFWLLPWWAAFGAPTAGARPVVGMRTWPDGSLAGLLPLYEDGGAKMLPLGVGISDYAGVLLDRDAPPDTAATLLAACLASARVGRCDIPELPPDDALINAPAPPGWHAETWPGPPCPVLALRPAPAIPAGMRRDIRQARHRAARAGGALVARATTPAEALAAFAALEALHGARWIARGEIGVLADDAVRRFHRAAVPALHDAGLLALTGVSLRGKTAAVVYGLLDRHRLHFYLGGFDPASAHESPGTLAIAALIDEAATENRSEAHFLRGAERYKYAWGAVDRRNTGRRLVRA